MCVSDAKCDGMFKIPTADSSSGSGDDKRSKIKRRRLTKSSNFFIYLLLFLLVCFSASRLCIQFSLRTGRGPSRNERSENLCEKSGAHPKRRRLLAKTRIRESDFLSNAPAENRDSRGLDCGKPSRGE